MADKYNIPNSTLAEKWASFKTSQLGALNQKNEVLLSPEEEKSLNATTPVVIAIIRGIHSRAVASGEKRQNINSVILVNSCVIFINDTQKSVTTGLLSW